MGERQQQRLNVSFADPPREFGVMPFWFWNDDLTQEELLRQIREFHSKGFGGFIPHARVGLSRRIGYLTDEYFRFLRLAVEEAHRLGMKVVLYDEGSYPSGSAQGRVVAENPAYAARCLIAVQREITGPVAGYWRPNPGRAIQDQLLCVVQGRQTSPGSLVPDTLKVLSPQEHELVRYELPEGAWRLIACWHVYSGGTIRGVFDEEEDGHALAPPAADIMNPEAVSCFLRHTHERFYERLQPYFGSTVVGMFTDEPSPMGRGPKRGPDPIPYTPGLLDDVQGRWDGDVRRWLPALWLDCGPRTAEFRRAYDRAVHDRIERVFYAAQSRWCAEHGIALTGHPQQSNEMGALRHFHWPGQDMVGRWVTPGSPTALEGPNSVAPKAASSAAALAGRRRNASEALGAYGWRLTLDEAKWLLDWHLVRGNNLFFPHACFYSIRGRRAFESEPDLGVHNVWWPHFGLIADYLRRLCWLLTDGVEVCQVAVLTDPDRMAWAAARELFQNQIDFIYIDEAALEHARIKGGRLAIGSQHLRSVVCDPTSIAGGSARAKLDAFRAGGGLVLESWQPGALASELVAAIGRDIDWPNAPDLRALHYRKAGRDFYLLVNEGERPLEGEFSIAAAGALELWDPMDGSTRPWPGRAVGGRAQSRLCLERRQALVIAVNPRGKPDPQTPLPAVPGETLVELSGPWCAWDTSGRKVEVPCPGNWARIRGWETFSGTLRFSTEFALPSQREGDTLFVDLGRAGDIAKLLLNGQPVGTQAWAPYIFDVTRFCRAGANWLEVRVTNSMANACDGLQMPSGLIGPVTLRAAAQPRFA